MIGENLKLMVYDKARFSPQWEVYMFMIAKDSGITCFQQSRS